MGSSDLPVPSPRGLSGPLFYPLNAGNGTYLVLLRVGLVVSRPNYVGTRSLLGPPTLLSERWALTLPPRDPQDGIPLCESGTPFHPCPAFHPSAGLTQDGMFSVTLSVPDAFGTLPLGGTLSSGVRTFLPVPHGGTGRLHDARQMVPAPTLSSGQAESGHVSAYLVN